MEQANTIQTHYENIIAHHVAIIQRQQLVMEGLVAMYLKLAEPNKPDTPDDLCYATAMHDWKKAMQRWQEDLSNPPPGCPNES